ncbi:MAG: dihydroorotate dehydrogenase-like protein [Rikenellaceae bacterium]
MNINTKFLSLEIKSPIIIGSSPLTADFKTIKKCADQGAGAVVLKSIFEERIANEVADMLSSLDSPESHDYLSSYLKQGDLDRYTTLIKECKAELDIPVIASVNCKTSGEWIDYCKKIEDAGADALELNIFYMPASKTESSQEIEARYLKVVEDVVKHCSIPLCVKLSSRFTNPIYMINELCKRGVKGVTMFNRFWEPDFDISKFEIVSVSAMSSPRELNTNLRYVSQAASANIPVDICASTGVYTSDDIVKYILAGASTVQVCSVLFSAGISVIGDLNSQLLAWMESHGFSSINEFKGKMLSDKDQTMHTRFQFMKQFD